MKAIVIAGAHQVELTTVDDPTPAAGEVVVRVIGSGICGTDIHLAEGLFGTFPLIPGHEFSGEVVALGAGVAGLRVGDFVAADPNLPCGACRQCQVGRVNLCENYAALGINRPGSAAEFIAVPEAVCVKLGGEQDVAAAALIEPLSCALHAMDLLRTPLGSHALIYGAGTMGLMMLQLTKLAGLSTVNVVDVNERKLLTADELGSSGTATSAAQLDRAEWDLVIDATGAAPAIADGLTRVAPAGTFLQFGVSNPEARVELSPYWVFEKEITIQGAVRPRFSFARAAQLFADGVLDPTIFISDELPLERYSTALERFAQGASRKIIIRP